VVIKSEGNPDCHIILRGGTLPNYHQSDVMEAAERLERQGLSPRLMIDCSHGNSQKQHRNQLRVAESLCRQLSEGSGTIAAVMVESFLQGGSQKPAPLSELQYGLSVTDACLCWEESETLLAMLAEAVQTRRRAAKSRGRAVVPPNPVQFTSVKKSTSPSPKLFLRPDPPELCPSRAHGVIYSKAGVPNRTSMIK